MHLRYSLSILIVCFAAAIPAVPGQAASNPTAPRVQPSPTPTPVAAPALNSKEALRNLTAEQVAEGSIFLYGLGGGRPLLTQIRKTTIERGKTTVMNAEGRMEQANYQKWVTRGDTLQKEKIRLDQEFPTARYSLIYSDEKTFGIFDDRVFTPIESASRAFQNQIFYNLESLLRYKENESKIELAGKEKVGGVEFHLLDVTDKQNRKMRFFISAKSFRVLMLDYEDMGIKYRRRFYDYNSAQGTLVPFRTVLYANDKVIEETDIGTVTYGQKLEDSLFVAG